MQTDSFQTDTSRTDSPAVPVPDTVLPDTVSREAKPDSFPSAEKKDSLPPAPKKTSIKTPPADTSIAKKSLALPADTPSKDTGLTGKILPDTIVAKELQRDTFRIAEKSIESEDLLPLRLRNPESNSWIIVLFLVIFSALAWIKVGYSRRIRQFFEAFLSNRYIRQLVREEFVFTHPSSITLTVIFLLTSALLLTQASHWFHWNIFTDADTPPGPGNLYVFFKIFLSLSVFYILKILVIRLSAFLFQAWEELTEYLFNLLLFNNILGLLLLPLTIGAIYATAISPTVIIIFSGGLALAAFLFRIVKCIFIGSVTTKISKSYIILYICTLEILPLFVVIKAFAG